MDEDVANANPLRAALEPYFAPLLEEMKRLNKNLETLIEGNPVEAFIVKELRGDLVVGDKTQNSIVRVGDVGQNANVSINQNVAWTEAITSLPEGDALRRQFAALLDKIDKDDALDEDTRHLARAKAEAIAEGLGAVEKTPSKLRRALIDAKSGFTGATSWVGAALTGILKSDAAQKTLGTVAEATTKAAIDGFFERF